MFSSAPPQIANRGGGVNAQQLQQQANSNTTANGINGNSHNGSNANLDSPLTMQKQQQPQQQLRQQHKKRQVNMGRFKRWHNLTCQCEMVTLSADSL
jgi:hypothetical protein